MTPVLQLVSLQSVDDLGSCLTDYPVLDDVIRASKCQRREGELSVQEAT